MRNIKLWIAAAVIMLALICVGAASADIGSNNCGAEGSNVTWTLNSEGVLSITGTGAMKNYDYDEDYNYDYDLSAPTTPWKNYLRQIKSVMISNGMTRIGNGAFGGCSSMTGIEIPDSVTSIGNDAFCYRINLTSIALPGSMTSIGGNAFFCCSRLTSIAISDGVTEIGADAFYGCISLTNIVLPASVTSIGDWAFGGCSGLTNIVIPASVTHIGEGTIPDAALIYCYADSYAVEWAKNNGMSSSVRYLIPEDAAIMRLPEGLTEICDEAYMNTAVEIVRLPENCVKIGARAFANCAQLWQIEIPAMHIEIADDAFADSPNVVIYAPAGSAAKAYAEAHGLAYLEK